MAAVPSAQSASTLVATEYSHASTEDALEILVKRMLYAFARSSDEMAKRCQKAYADLFNGRVMLQQLEDEQFPGIYLHGPPGHGKTSVCRAAAKVVAKALGLTFQDNPEENFSPTENDFYFISQEMSGETSKLEFGGMPSKRVVQVGDKETSYMTKLPSERLAKAKFAGASFLLFDDFANAAAPIQNIALPIIEEKRFQGINLGNVFCAFTGNLGSLDGTHTTGISNAAASRCTNLYIEDTYENFAKRVRMKYKDSVADAGVLAYLKSMQGNFAKMPPKKGVPFPCPRTWERVLPVMRSLVHEMKSSKEGVSASDMRLLRVEVEGLLGRDVGFDFVEWQRGMLSDAIPMAEEMLEKGELDETHFNAKVGKRANTEEVAFAYRFANALANGLAVRLLEDESGLDDANADTPQNKAIRNFSKGISYLMETEMTIAVEVLRHRLVYHSKTYFQETGAKSGLIKGYRQLDKQKALQVYRGITSNPRIGERAAQAIESALSGGRKLFATTTTQAASAKVKAKA